MLTFDNGTFTETGAGATSANAMMMQTGGAGGSLNQNSNWQGSTSYGGYWPYQSYWMSYPVYICSDKTKKAIEVLKALQAEKLLKCESVPRFIELVEKISNLL